MRKNLMHKNAYLLEPVTQTGATVPVNSSYDYYKMSGGTTITALTTGFIGKQVCVELLTTTTLTHSATLVLPDAADFEGGVGDVLRFAQTSSTVWTCISNNSLGGSATKVGSLVLTDGQMIFPATQDKSSDANTLDDYEEGYFLPSIVCSTSGDYGCHPNYPWTYTKVGNSVSLYGTIMIYSAHSPNGQIRISLPFPNAITDCTGICTLIGSGTPNTGNIRAYVDGSFMNIERINASGIYHYLDNTDVDTNWYFAVNLKYKIT